MKVHLNQALAGRGELGEIIEVEDGFGAAMVESGFADEVTDGPVEDEDTSEDELEPGEKADETPEPDADGPKTPAKSTARKPSAK